MTLGIFERLRKVFWEGHEGVGKSVSSYPTGDVGEHRKLFQRDSNI